MRIHAQDGSFRAWLGRSGPETTLTLLTIAFAACSIAFVWLFPPAAVFPALSLLIIAAALGVAGAAWVFSARQQIDAVSYWDVAGGLMLIGVAAALLADGDGVLLHGWDRELRPG